jgi:hypothetical protein
MQSASVSHNDAWTHSGHQSCKHDQSHAYQRVDQKQIVADAVHMPADTTRRPAIILLHVLHPAQQPGDRHHGQLTPLWQSKAAHYKVFATMALKASMRVICTLP